MAHLLLITCKQCGNPFSTKDASRVLCSRKCVAAHLGDVARAASGSKSPAYRHGATVDRKDSPEYSSWRAMVERCHNPRAVSYPYYGERGITVCAEWRGPGGFRNFLAHVGPKPDPKHSIDRIDNDGRYEPGNVRWATQDVQARNRPPRKLFTHCRRGHPRTPENRVANGSPTGACGPCREITDANRLRAHA